MYSMIDFSDNIILYNSITHFFLFYKIEWINMWDGVFQPFCDSEAFKVAKKADAIFYWNVSLLIHWYKIQQTHYW